MLQFLFLFFYMLVKLFKYKILDVSDFSINNIDLVQQCRFEVFFKKLFHISIEKIILSQLHFMN